MTDKTEGGGQVVMGNWTLNDDVSGDYDVIAGSSLIVNCRAQSNVTVRQGGKLEVKGFILGTLINEGGEVTVREGAGINITHDNGDLAVWSEKGSSVNEYWSHGKKLIGPGYFAPREDWPKRNQSAPQD